MADPTPAASSPMMAVAVSALKAQQARMRVIAENIANAEFDRHHAGRRLPTAGRCRCSSPARSTGRNGVQAGPGRARTRAPSSCEYDPGHPAADAKGYVKRPNVDPLVEALDMREAQRAYEANLNVIDTARAMDNATLGILKK